ncbi:hypothetical protein [Curtanaerobium respiraculi]|uniref:hypothetical protein n=1 Tax=Curtanaerobium respiraculi TaxID=2949669 RepID=UPI0024B3C14A|nr:hypothetical protein [Curtanaerobium respiraculi]
MKRLTALVLAAAMVAVLAIAGCGAGVHKMRIENVNARTDTFDFVDNATGETISYDTLVISGKKVVDHSCMSSMDGTVVFAFEGGQIKRDSNTTTYNGGRGITTAAVLTYELSDGVLTVTDIE